ncbi:MFS transporter [Streptomyces sp. NPDC051940]|uniref:MFS transporter n=1 Tax=Streptomyces sp. NPDC051940 TaxID=3155675 RepID=UPI0034291A68
MRALRDVPRTVWLLAGGNFFNNVVAFTFVYLFVHLTAERGLSVTRAGLISGIAGVGQVAGNFTGGWFGDRFGHRRVMLTGAVVAGAGLIALPATPVALLYAVLPVAQYAQGVVRAGNASLVAVTVQEGGRRQAFAVMRFAANAGFTVGPPTGALLAAHYSYGWLFVVNGIGTLLFACYAAKVLPARGAAAAPAATGGPGLWSALRARPAVLVMLAAVLVTDTVYRQQYSTLPVFLTDHGVDPSVYGWLLAINGGVILCLELPASFALRRHAPLRVIGLGLALVGLGYALLVGGAAIPLAVGMMLLLSAGEILYKTPAMAYVADQSPAHTQGRFQSLYAGVSVSGVVLAPPLGATVYDTAPSLLWPLCAVLACAAGVAVLVASRRPAPRRASAAGVAAAPTASVGGRRG